MSQLARRENAPHRAAFVTSLSRSVVLATCLLSIPACLRRGGPVLPLAGLRHPTDILHGNQGTASPFCLPPSVSGTGRLIGWNVPNYQGVFLRGYGGQTSYHYGAVGHWSAGLGELQGDGIREIWGELSYLPRSRDGEVGQSGSLAFWNEGRNQWMNDTGKAPSGAMNFYASRSTPVVGEVRPVNRAVRYLIRAK